MIKTVKQLFREIDNQIHWLDNKHWLIMPEDKLRHSSLSEVAINRTVVMVKK